MLRHLLPWIWANLPHPVCRLLCFVSGLQWILVLPMPSLCVFENRGVGASTDRFTEKWLVNGISTINHRTPAMFFLRKSCLHLWHIALQLVIVFLLGLSIIFMYAVTSFAFFHGHFDVEEGLFCETLAQCFLTVTREGLLDTLGSVSFTSFI